MIVMRNNPHQIITREVSRLSTTLLVCNFLLLLLLLLFHDVVVVVAPILSSVPTSEALLPLRSSRRPHLRPHPRLIPHRGPAHRGPQEVTSGRWWAAIRRRHSAAVESLRWCSLMPVLIQHTQGITCCAPLLSTVLGK